MTKRNVFALTGAVAAAAAATTLVAVPALASGPGGGRDMHTVKFTAIPTRYHYYNKAQTLGFEVDKDVRNGKIIGSNIVEFINSPRSDVAIALRGGFIYGEFTVSSTGTIRGRVTGGSADYRGVRGTIGGTATPKQADVTLTYSRRGR